MPEPNQEQQVIQNNEEQQTDQQRAQSFWDGDPNKLAPELQELYKNMQRGFNQKAEEFANARKKYEEEIGRYRPLEDEVQRYRQDAETWKQWVPTLQKLSQPDVWEKVQHVLTGEEPTGKQAAVQNNTNVGEDDEFMTVAAVRNYIADLEKKIGERTQQQSQAMLSQAAREVQQWIQNYFSLADNLRRQELRHLYGLEPREGAYYDSMKVLRTAQERGLTDLDAAYQLAYGDEVMKRSQQQWEQDKQTAIQKAVEEAKQAAKEEALRELRNQQAGNLFTGGQPAKLDFGKQPSRDPSYKQASEILREKLQNSGLPY